MIRAIAYARAGYPRAKFDASDFFENTIDRHIVHIALNQWIGEAVRSVAWFCAGTGDFPQLTSVVEAAEVDERSSFEVEIYGPDALAWLRQHRPDIVARIEDALGRGSCDHDGPYPAPPWDDDPEWPDGYERRRGSAPPSTPFR
ncbi:hypothetical protein [Methylobacterium radiotolerans]|uniref:hypothetical protein n=1 Tax=Methylobacterium radiotolerans TaxID=31998 RepID=UPI0038D067C8